MWDKYCEDYRLFGRVLPVSQVVKELPDLNATGW